jgi:chromosomal replication initiator protein
MSTRPKSCNYQEAWERVRARLRFRYGEATFNSWLKPLSIDSTSENEVILSAPTRFLKEWVITNYIDGISETWAEEGVTGLVDVRVAKAGSDSRKVTDDHEQVALSQNQYSKPEAPKRNYLTDLNSTLDERFTFENFIVGASNELAYAAANAVAESKRAMKGSNPLFLHSGVGLGKTHLMHAVAHAIKEKSPERKVAYLSAEKFMYQFIKALRNKEIVEFKEQFRSVDVLMIDDIQFICGKDSTQEEFFHTFNALMDNKCQLIISADRSPSDLDGMEERVRSRLGWGLVADINKATYELRLGILQAKAEQLETEVPGDVMEFLARKINSNIRELEGALNKVVAHSSLMKRDVTLEATQTILRDLLRSNNKIITVEEIQKTVCQHCNIRMSDMSSSRRAQNVARPRQLAMYLAKRLTPHSLPEIGRKFGGRDHTTVMHAVKRIDQLCEKDKSLSDDLNLLTRMLQS